jgi:hypothetical protein
MVRPLSSFLSLRRVAFEVVVAGYKVGDVAVTGDAGYAGWVTGDIFVTRPDPGYHPTP